MTALFVLGCVLLLVASLVHSAWRWVAYGLAGYFLLGAGGMLFYSKVGKLALRERLLDKIPGRGDERVLDVGCGRGLLAVGAAHRVSSSVLENAAIERAQDRVAVQEGDARKLPFADGTFDVVVLTFVVHELKSRAGRREHRNPEGAWRSWISSSRTSVSRTEGSSEWKLSERGMDSSRSGSLPF